MPIAPCQETLNSNDCYAALLKHDVGADGHWYVGVTSTGIYCRPICRVRTPKPENCRFFKHAAQAEAAQFRPCLKCRPELAPGRPLRWSVMDASSTLAQQARSLLDANLQSGQAHSLEMIAQRLGVTARHLRRIFAVEYGVSPIQYLQTQRLLRAKQMLTDTLLPMSEIAHRSGFASLRRFNAAFALSYRMQPSQLRSTNITAKKPLNIPVSQPYNALAMLEFLARRAIPGVEVVDLESLTIARTLRLSDSLTGWLRIGLDPNAQLARVESCASLQAYMLDILEIARRWLDLTSDGHLIDSHLSSLPACASHEPGIRLPGCVDRFELAVRAILGQQISVAGARTMANRLNERYGQALEPQMQDGVPAGLTHLFALPETLAHAGAQHIAQIGLPQRRAETLHAVAQRWPTLALAKADARAQDIIPELLSIPGLGPWTAQYIVMRALSHPDAWPAGDLILRRQLAPVDSPKPLTERACETAAQAWQPYRSYAVMRLWRGASLPPLTENLYGHE